MEFTITALDGDSVKVESENWLTAMGKALSFFDIDITRLERITCSVGEDGSVLVEDGERSWMVRPHDTDILVKVTDKSPRETWTPRQSVVSVTPEADLGADRPAVQMPESSLKRDEPRTLAEHLFELTTGLHELTAGEVADRALEAIHAFVRPDGSCVVRGTLDDPTLEVVAARGPHAERWIGRRIGFGEGLVGMAYDMRETLAVPDVTPDTPHVDLVDAGALSVLCVPLLDDEGGPCGVVQLVNPADRPFTDANTGVAEVVARTLATALAGR